MKKKFFTFIISGIMISLNASSQTIRDNIDKLAKDKATQEERAAKADVYIMKKTISDSTQFKTTPAAKVSKTSTGTSVSKARKVTKVKSSKTKYKKKSKPSTK
jgi:Fic family protein